MKTSKKNTEESMSTSIMDIDKKKLDLVIASINKQFGANTVIFGDTLPEDVDVISSGNFKLDLGLQVGGFPRGRIVEIFGGEGLGKSLLALSTVAEAQAAGSGLVGYIDAECDTDPDWATKLGVKLDELVFAQPEYGEKAFEILHSLLESNMFSLIVVDSVAALTPKAEYDSPMLDNHVGLQARMMAQGLRKTRALISSSNTCVIFINQIRDKIGFMQSGTTSPGGRALKFYSSVRIELKKIQELKSTKTGESIGLRVKALILKNKVGKPMRSVEYNIIHGMGFSNFSSILELADKHGLIIKKGGGYYYKIGEEKSFAHGEDDAVGYLASDLDWVEELKSQIKEKELGISPKNKDLSNDD